MINIRITGMKEVKNAFRNLPKELKKEISNGGMTFMRAVKKSAKLRAPRFTEYLASSIFVDKRGKNEIILSVDAPYAAKMETGKGLPRYMPIKRLRATGWLGRKIAGDGFITASRTRGKKEIAGYKPPKKGMVVISHYKPFIQPALEHNIAKLQTILSDKTNKAIRGSFR